MIIDKFLDPNVPSLPQQVAQNTRDIAAAKNVYKTSQNLPTTTTTVQIATTNIINIDDCLIDRFLFSRNGLLFKIVSYTADVIYVEFYSDLSSTNEVITNLEFEPESVIYNSGIATLTGKIKYNQDSLLEPMEAPAEINIPITAVDGVIIDASEDNSSIEAHLDSTTIANPNLLINSNFTINQRGEETYSGNGTYCVDRWQLYGSGGYSVDTKQYSTAKQNNRLIQWIENYEALRGKKLTLSCNFVAGSKFRLIAFDGVNYFYSPTLTTGINKLTFTVDQNASKLSVGIQNVEADDTNNVCTLDYVKLEIGELATEFSPRPIAEELVMCQRFFEKIDLKNSLNYSQIYRVTSSPYAFYNGNIDFKISKRTLPTVKVFSSVGFTEGKLYDDTLNSDISISLKARTLYGFFINPTGAESVTQGHICRGYYSADAEIYE